MRLGVDDAQGAYLLSRRRAQQCAGIEADMRSARHQRIVAESSIPGRIKHYEDIVAADRVRAERDLPGGLADVQTDAGSENLPLRLDKRDERDWHLEYVRGELHEALEPRLGERVVNAVFAHRRKALVLSQKQRHGVGLARKSQPCARRPNTRLAVGPPDLAFC